MYAIIKYISLAAIKGKVNVKWNVESKWNVEGKAFDYIDSFYKDNNIHNCKGRGRDRDRGTK